jgi:hypothetical protein
MIDPIKSPDPLYDPSYGDAVVLITDLKTENAKLRAERFDAEKSVNLIAARCANFRAALETINRPFDTTMTGLETANLLRAIARRALEEGK